MLPAMDKLKSDIQAIIEVDGYVKVAERTLYHLAGAKKIQAFKVGGTRRLLCTDIDQWISRQMSETLCNNGSDSPGEEDLRPHQQC